MTYSMLHGLGDCTPKLHCGCLAPTVTDNARAEAWDEGWMHGTDALDGPGDLRDNPYRAAGRAETTTATTEDMATRLAAAEAELDRLCDGGRFIMSIPAREGYDSDLLIQAALSDLRGLLATARTLRARLAAVEALADEYADAPDDLAARHVARRILAVLSAAPTNTTKEN